MFFKREVKGGPSCDRLNQVFSEARPEALPATSRESSSRLSAAIVEHRPFQDIHSATGVVALPTQLGTEAEDDLPFPQDGHQQDPLRQFRSRPGGVESIGTAAWSWLLVSFFGAWFLLWLFRGFSQIKLIPWH